MTDERAQRVKDVLRYRQNDLTVVLENVEDPHNISAVMRSCDSVGIKEIYIVNTKLTPHRKFGARSSSGARKWVMVQQFTSISECMKVVRSHYNRVWSTHLSADAKSLYDLDLTNSTALVFGNEAKGLSAEMIAHCDGNFIIPQLGMSMSLNISVACAVSIFEAYRQKNLAGHYRKQKITESEVADIKSFWKIYER